MQCVDDVACLDQKRADARRLGETRVDPTLGSRRHNENGVFVENYALRCARVRPRARGAGDCTARYSLTGPGIFVGVNRRTPPAESIKMSYRRHAPVRFPCRAAAIRLPPNGHVR